MSQAILDALGVTDESQALRAIAASSELITDLRNAVGKETFAETLQAVRQNATLVRGVADATGKPPAEALGVLLAWKASHELVMGTDEEPGLQAQLAEARADVETRDRAELIKQGQAERKLTPASAKFWEDKPVEQLRAFLETAPTVIPALLKAPKDQGNGGDPNGSDKRFEDMSPKERHQLLETVGAEAYEAIKADAASRNGGVAPPPALSDDYAS